MISFLSSPKPFKGVAQLHQMNAIRSWLAVCPNSEVILYGDSEGTQEAAQQFRIRHVPSIKSNKYGTPLFNAIVNQAKENATHEYHVYINCDIVLTQVFADTLQRIRFPQFLMIGQRIDLRENILWDLSEMNFRQQLARLCLAGNISLHPPGGSDYFAFKRGLWDNLPPITIGRGGYDNALIYHALSKRIPIIDATFSVYAIHQFHDYGHMLNGQKDVFEGPEAIQNTKYAGKFGVPALTDATWIIDKQTCFRNYGRGDWMRFLECYCRFVLKNELLGYFCRQLRRVLLRLGFSRQKIITLKEILEI